MTTQQEQPEIKEVFFVVTGNSYDDRKIQGIFSTIEYAELLKKRLDISTDSTIYNPQIESHPLDAGVDILCTLNSIYSVQFKQMEGGFCEFTVKKEPFTVLQYFRRSSTCYEGVSCVVSAMNKLEAIEKAKTLALENPKND